MRFHLKKGPKFWSHGVWVNSELLADVFTVSDKHNMRIFKDESWVALPDIATCVSTIKSYEFWRQDGLWNVSKVGEPAPTHFTYKYARTIAELKGISLDDT